MTPYHINDNSVHVFNFHSCHIDYEDIFIMKISGTLPIQSYSIPNVC